jgi:hypothetical protein
MSKQANAATKDVGTPETATASLVAPPAAAGDAELSDADLDKVAGGFAPAPARKAGRPPKDYA